MPQAPYGKRLQTLLTGQWSAHFAFTRINITPTILRKKIEDVREAGEFDVDRELIIPRISTVASGDDAQEIRAARYGRRGADVTMHSGARRELRSIGREPIGPIPLLGIRLFNLRAPQGDTAPILSAINAKSRAETFTSPNLKAAPQRDLLVMKDRCSFCIPDLSF